jgi:predicted MFS family arabinose efflux permease
MTTEAVNVARTDLRRSGFAVAALFFVNGMTFSNWIPRIPEVRDRLGLDNAGLGATLLGGGLGGLIGSFLVAKVIARFGTRNALTVAASLLAVALPLIAVAPSAAVLLLVLTLLGFLDVINDMAMNSQGVMVEQQLGRSIINRLHGTWSLGFTLGTLLGLLASAAELGVGTHLTIIAMVLLATVLGARRYLLTTDDANGSDDTMRKASRRISGALVAMALMAIGISFIEIVPNDWGSVLLRDVFVAGRWSGAANVAFAGSMLVGRMSGDHVLERIGRTRLLNGALMMAALGAAIVVVAPVTGIAIAGFALWGLGVSVLFPQLYAIAATLKNASAGAGLGAMGVGQRLGFLLAPLGVGAVANASSLRVAIGVITGAAVIAIVATRRMA